MCMFYYALHSPENFLLSEYESHGHGKLKSFISIAWLSY